MTISPDAVETLALRAERPRAARLKSSSPDEIIEFRDAHGIYWRVRPDWFERLQSSANQSSQLPPATSSLPIAEWIAAPTTKVVKHGPHRTVYRIVIDGATVYLKHDRVLRWTDVVRRIFKASPSRREWFNSLTLARRGVSTIHPIAFGETIRSGVVRDSYFLSLEIPHSEQLDVYLIRSLERRGATEDAARRRELIVALAELCVRCHEAGVDHQDFHSGNILIQTSADGSAPPRLFLIDLPAVAFRRPLSWPQTLNSLAMLNTGLRDLTRPQERREFLKAYFSRRRHLRAPDFDTAVREVSDRTWVLAQRNFHSRDKRAVRRNQDFQPHRFKHGVSYAIVDVRRAEASAAISTAIANDLTKRESGETSWRPVELELGGKKRLVACKTFDDWTGGLSWRRFWRWTPGLKRWVIGQALLARGIATPRPCLTWRPSKGPNRGQIFVACEWIAGAETLDAVLVRVAELPDGAARRVALDALAKQVGKLLGDLHRWGATHHDLNAASLLVDHVDWPSLVAGSKIAVKLVNLDSVVLGRSESLAAAAADLQTFAGSIPTAILSDLRTRRRFLSAYFATFRLSAPERRRRAALFAASIPFAGQSPQKTS